MVGEAVTMFLRGSDHVLPAGQCRRGRRGGSASAGVRLRWRVVVRGHNVFEGYHNNPQQTREVLVDGWFRTGDIGVAVVVPADGVSVKGDELIAWSREHLGRHKYPRIVEVVPELPMGHSHKIDKRALRARFGR